MIVIIMCFVQVLAAVAPADVVLPPIYVPGTWPSRLFDNDCVRVSPSHLHGSGVFAVALYPPARLLVNMSGKCCLCVRATALTRYVSQSTATSTSTLTHATVHGQISPVF